jgi:hypothetical protein
MIEALVERAAWNDLLTFIDRIAGIRAVDPLLDAVTERAAGRALAAGGELTGAREALSRALTAFQRFPHRFEAARTQEALAMVSEGVERERLLGEAIASYRSLRAVPHVKRAEGLLGAES